MVIHRRTTNLELMDIKGGTVSFDLGNAKIINMCLVYKEWLNTSA